MYTLGKRIRVAEDNAANAGAAPSDRSPRDRAPRARSPIPRRTQGGRGGGPPIESRGPRTFFKDARDRSPLLDTHAVPSRPLGAPQRPSFGGVHPDSVRAIERLKDEGRVKPDDLNERCLGALAEAPPLVQV